MGKLTRSARGIVVDFDLLKIKQQMVQMPKAAPVEARENFIDQRFKRRLNRAKKPIDVAPKTLELEESADTQVEEE